MFLFSFCESVTASGRSPWHIRALEKDPALKKSGGIDTDSLCGTVRAPFGWDLRPLADDWLKESFVCVRCRDRYEDYLHCGELYYEHDGKKYVRIRSVDGLERQLTDGVAKLEWYILHHPLPERPFFLLEFEMRRRMHVTSSHWFRPEQSCVYCPADKVPATFIRALESQKSGAFSNTGTSSGRKVKPSGRRTTSGSRR
jgi:hypothetical protein